MEYIQSIHVTSVTQEDLVNLFSTATYGNPDMGIEVSNDSLDIKARVETKDDCIEDIWAKVLLDGGHLNVVFEDDEELGERGKNWIKTEFVIHEGWGGREIPTIYYKIDLQNLIDGLNQPKATEYVHELLIKGEGDFYTAYNLMQIILFNEVVYG